MLVFPQEAVSTNFLGIEGYGIDNDGYQKREC
jgi:hypothetical protein